MKYISIFVLLPNFHFYAYVLVRMLTREGGKTETETLAFSSYANVFFDSMLVTGSKQKISGPVKGNDLGYQAKFS
jgi:hypothetical protein